MSYWKSFTDAAEAASNLATPLKGIASSVSASASKVLDKADSFVADSFLGAGEDGGEEAELSSQFDVEDENDDGAQGTGRRLEVDSSSGGDAPKTPKPASPVALASCRLIPSSKKPAACAIA